MGLPPYSGPWRVGAIDLEIPVREPRSFETPKVKNHIVNVPPEKRKGKRTRKEAGGKAERSGVRRGEHDSDDEDDEEQGGSSWNPFSSGCQTSTLHLATVLFTIYYPTGLGDKELQKYDHARWLSRPKRESLSAMFAYLGQYGPFAYPASPAILFLLSASMPAYVGPPLGSPSDARARAPPPHDRIETGNFGGQPPQFPVVVFSHGLAGNRLSYSQFLGELASQGCVVCAVEHRDGSGIDSQVRPPLPNPINVPRDTSSGSMQAGQSTSRERQEGGDRPEAGTAPTSQPGITTKSRTRAEVSEANEKLTIRDRIRGRKAHPKARVPYLIFETFGLRSFAPEPNEDEIDLRQAQLAMRHAELEECLHVMNRINNGEGAQVARESTRNLGSKLGDGGHRRSTKGKPESLEENPQKLAEWKGKLDMSYPALVGHSWGGATVIEACRRRKTAEGEEGESKPPIWPYAIVLDPWCEPIQMEDRLPIEVPLYTLNSEGFSVWQEHFQKLKQIMVSARDANSERRGWLMTLCGSHHLDFSDYPFLLPHVFRSTVGPSATIGVFSRATYAQMGLMRQRRRERLGAPGAKSGASGRQGAKGRDAAMGGESRLGVARSEDKAAGNIKMESDQAPASGNDTKAEGILRHVSLSKGKIASEEMGALATSPLSKMKGEDRDEHVEKLADAKNIAAHRLWSRKSQRASPGEGLRAEEAEGKEADGPSQAEASRCDVAEDAEAKDDEESHTHHHGHGHGELSLTAAIERLAEDRRERKERKKHLEANGIIVANRTSDGDLVGKLVLPDELPEHALDYVPDGVVVPADAEGQGKSDGHIAAATDQGDSGVPCKPPPPAGDADDDAAYVHSTLEDISKSLAYKRPKIHSLMGAMLRMKGLKPGLAQPGRVLVHDLDKRVAPAGEGMS